MNNRNISTAHGKRYFHHKFLTLKNSPVMSGNLEALQHGWEEYKMFITFESIIFL
jgi:hypothetical protein